MPTVVGPAAAREETEDEARDAVLWARLEHIGRPVPVRRHEFGCAPG